MYTLRSVSGEEFAEKLEETITANAVPLHVKACRQNVEIKTTGKIFRVFADMRNLVYVVGEEK